MSKKKQSFEEGMNALENLIASLSEGGLTLEESMKMYEQGVKLAAELEKTLEQHVRKIEMIDTQTGEIRPFEENQYGV